MNYGTEFKKYAMSDHNVSSSKLNYYEKQIGNSMTPYILEEREMRATQIDIFSRLMADRLLWVAGPVNDGMSTIVQAQLMFLDSVDKKDITMHIEIPLFTQISRPPVYRHNKQDPGLAWLGFKSTEAKRQYETVSWADYQSVKISGEYAATPKSSWILEFEYDHATIPKEAWAISTSLSYVRKFRSW